MLPIAAHGRTKRGGAIPVSYLYTTITVLVVLLFFIGSSLWHTRATLDAHAGEVSQLTRKLRSTESHLRQTHASMPQLEARIRQLEGSLADVTRDLRVRDNEITILEEQKTQADLARKNQEMDLEAKLEFEKTVVQTLNATIAQMEAAHNAREADWHELSARWMQFEQELTSDNERMLAELAKHEETKDAAQTGGFAHAHTMPQQEPLVRDESELKPRTQLPPEDDFLARQRQLWKEQERLRREQEQLAAEREAVRAGNVMGRRDLGASMGMGRERPPYEPQQEQGKGSSFEKGDRPQYETQYEQAPDIGHPHHDDHYDPSEHVDHHHEWAHGDDWDGAHRHWDDDYHPGSWDYDDYHGDWDHHGWDEDYGDHLDPLDQAWIYDGASPDGRQWPGSHPSADSVGDLPPEQQQGENDGVGSDVPPGGIDGGLPVEGANGGLPVLGREADPPPVLGKEELPVLGREENPPVLGREEELPVLGRDPQRGAPADPAAQSLEERGGKPTRWQKMQEAAMPGRFRHGR